MPDFKYTLTRYCLRAGQLTLPQSMLELFPSEGGFKAVDTKENEEFTLTMSPPRTVTGLGGFIELHNLKVNDAIEIRLQEDGHYAFTPLLRSKSIKESVQGAQGAEVGEELLDALAEKRTPLSEAEIRQLYPSLSRAAALGNALAQDARFCFEAGRWHPAASLEAEPIVPDASPLELPVTPESRASELGTSDLGSTVPKPPAKKRSRASVTPYPRGVIFPDDAGLNSEQEPGDLSQQQRAKSLLTALGYRVEGLAHGQLMAHAELGRRHYSALIHILPEGSKLDWAALMARRREAGATYAAVFGHQLDLASLEGAAELARSTLWSWTALGRLEGVLEAVPVSPVDLEVHFDKDGLFDRGLDRFERMVQKRIAERGTFSAVLAQLATLRAPTIFMLDDVAGVELSRDQVLKVLDHLSHAPFHLVTKVGSGEFCLHFRVADSLLKLSEYALSLRDRLPSRRTERLRGESVLSGGSEEA